MKLAKVLGTLGLMAFAGLASRAATADDSGWYGGLNVGQSRAKIDDPRITSALLGGGFATSSITNDDQDTAYKIYGGFRINRNFAVEGGYFNLGKFGFTADTLPPGTLNGSIRLQGLNMDAVGILPITDKFSAFGRVGVVYAQANDAFSSTGFVHLNYGNPSRSAANYKFGLGAQYDFTDSLGMRVEAERYRIDDAVGNKGDVDLISVGLVYRFGGHAPATVPRAAAPEPVAAAAEPQPEVPPPPAAIVSPPPPSPVKVTLSADSLFDFGQAKVTPEGKQKIDRLAADLNGVNIETMTVTGHTDRIGSEAYNLALSAHRADAVKAYLVESAGIPAEKITARGADGSDPVTKPGECKGMRRTPRLIACLQPDRRVEIEVSGNH